MFLRYGGKDNGDIPEGCDLFTDEVFEFKVGLGLFFNKVPFIHHNHYTLSVFNNELKDVLVLGLKTLHGIDHQETNVAVFYSPDRPQYGIKLNVLPDFAFFPESSRVHQ